MGCWRSQRDRSLAQGGGAGLPRIAACGWGMGDAASTSRAGQNRTAAACAVGTNPGAVADDRSRPLDQGADVDGGCRLGRCAGAGRGARGGGRVPDDGPGNGAGKARSVTRTSWLGLPRLVRPRRRSGPSPDSGGDHVAMVKRLDGGTDHETRAHEAPDVRSRQVRTPSSSAVRQHFLNDQRKSFKASIRRLSATKVRFFHLANVFGLVP